MTGVRPPNGAYTEDAASRAVYSRAACIYRRWPQGVCHPKSAEDLEWAVARCREGRIPLTLRGGGSGLAGQTVGEGVIADTSKWMTRIGPVDRDRRSVEVQPGVVLADLNRALAPSGLRFAPDPSSQDFCTLGGMWANNSKGARSVKYGTTAEHVLALDLLFSDGSGARLERGARRPEEYGHPRLRRAAELIAAHRETILAGWPRSRTNASGYNLKGCLSEDPGKVDLVPLFVGSEGTLAVFLGATLGLLPTPKHQSLTLLGFSGVGPAARAVRDLLPLGPSALELLDETLLRIIRGGHGTFPLPVEDEAHALLLLETDGGTRDEAEAAMDGMLETAASFEPTSVRRAATPSERAAIWSFRKAASPLLNRGRGRLKSIRFIEDGAVPTEAIPDYLKGVAEIVGARGIEVVLFGHAGDGNLHANPFMDLRDAKHFEQMPLIAAEQARLLADLGGTLSGEHGDGRLRTPYLRVIYGDLVDLFRQIKLALDPEEILNPGIIAPEHAEPMDTGIRFTSRYERVGLAGRLSEEGWAFEAERCHGCGTCRDFCPTAQATDDDLLSSRGRAHLLQALLAGDLSEEQARRPEVRAVFDSCLGCSLCALGCPTGVDVAPLAAVFRAAYTPGFGRGRDRVLGSLPTLGYRAGPALGRLAVKVGGSALARPFGAALFGIRSDLSAPVMAAGFAFELGKLYRYPGSGAAKAVYFYGCYGNTYNPDGEARLAVAILSALGVDVVVPPQACCGVSKMTRGLLDMAAPDVAYNREILLPYVRQGFTVVASAPSCLLALKREQPRFYAGQEGEELAAACRPFFSFIRERLEERPGTLAPVRARAVYQTPCHGAVLSSYQDEVEVLRRIPGLEIVDVTEECCGLSGSFGVEARHAALSDAIAMPLVARIKRASPDLIITPCGSCRTQDEAKLGLTVVHPLALLARALGLSLPAVNGRPCPSSERASESESQ